MPADHSQILLVFGAISKKWSPPKGGLEPGESLPQGAKRECYEETGLCVDFPDDSTHLNIRKQHYFSLVADRNVVDLPLKPWDVREIEKVCWLTWDEIDALPKHECNAITLELRRPATRSKIIAMSIPAATYVGKTPPKKRGPVGLDWD